MVSLINNTIFKIIFLYKGNYKKSFHVREIAKLINTSHVAILPHLKELVNNNILQSKIKGRNKIFFLNLNNVLTKDFLKISEYINAIESINKHKFLEGLYKEIHNLPGTFILVNPQNIEVTLKIIYIGNSDDLKNKNIKSISDRFNIKITIITGSLEQFESQLIKQSNFIKNLLKNHIILTNTEIFVNSLYKYFKNK
ncbi:hypothetical protein GOV12_02720 [Candidatus Pacearchaeota archaeon]|nr:hypothetical protein [Candidatus Pacearchaeota archaeon]